MLLKVSVRSKVRSSSINEIGGTGHFHTTIYCITIVLYDLSPEVTLNVLSHLPIPSLLSLRLLSRQWSDFVIIHQSVIFHGAASKPVLGGIYP